MAVYKLGAVEARFAELIWANEPLSSNRLAKLAEQELSWKKSTTYTILKRLCERGLFRNEGGEVSSLVSREEFQAAQSEQFVDEAFGGSLPAFVAAFGRRKKLSDAELDELARLVERMRG
ncbi:MAG: BlaI/MecI/CopY family transcriptional regulator [Candidatus Scatomorpha sp.]|jgi:predicted transcriptional regulator